MLRLSNQRIKERKFTRPGGHLRPAWRVGYRRWGAGDQRRVRAERDGRASDRRLGEAERASGGCAGRADPRRLGGFADVGEHPRRARRRWWRCAVVNGVQLVRAGRGAGLGPCSTGEVGRYRQGTEQCPNNWGSEMTRDEKWA